MKDTHMRTMTHLIAGGIAATTLLAGTAVTASAQSTTIRDKRADVVHYEDFGAEDGTVLNRSESTKTGVDVTSTVIKHGKKTLRVTIRFADLARKDVFVSAGIRIKGSTARYTIQNEGSKKKVRVYDASNYKQLCTGELTYESGKKGKVTYSIPRSCIKKPKSIKVQASTLRPLDFDSETEAFEVVMDIVSPSKFRNPSWTKWLKAN